MIVLPDTRIIDEDTIKPTTPPAELRCGHIFGRREMQPGGEWSFYIGYEVMTGLRFQEIELTSSDLSALKVMVSMLERPEEVAS